MRRPLPVLVLSLLLAIALGFPPARPALDAQEALPALEVVPAQEPLATQEESGYPSPRGPTDPAEFEAFVDGVMHGVLEEFDVAGAVVSVVSGGETFFAKGYGFSDWEAREPVDPETTLFRIGSVSKLFVWTSVMQMVERGLLDLDVDVNEYLDIEIPATFDEPVTLSDIMGHAGGFEDYVIELFGDDPEDVRPLGELLADQIPARIRPNRDLSSYSNHATGMAAYMVERASGTEWKEYVEQNIFAPLGMEYSTFRQPLPDGLEPHMSKGYRYAGDRFEEEDFEYVPLAPVGAAAASAADMARFMVAHLQLGQYGDQQILSEETARLMQSDHHRMDPEVNGMAHGFMVYSQNGERIIGHGGDTRVFHTGLWLFPERDLGLFVSFNSVAGGGARNRLFSAIMDRYFPVDESIPVADEEFKERAGRFTGEYRANRFSHTSITKIAAVQTTSVSATSRGTLRALGAHWIEETPLTFREEYGTRTLVFREDAEGNITHFLLSSSPIVAWERPPPSEIPALHLGILVLAVVAVVLTLLSPFLGWGIRRWHRVPDQELVRIPKGARVTLWLTALLWVMSVSILLPNLLPEKISVEVPSALGIALLFPILAGIMTVGAAVYAVRIWAKRQGRSTIRVLYSVAVVAFLLFLWQLSVWNLLGWNY